MNLNDNEYIEFLESCEKNIIVNNGLFKITSDPLLLAEFAKENIKKNGILLDIGAGNGILPLLLSTNIYLNKIYAVEIQEKSYKYLKRNISINSIKEKIFPYHSDINNFFSEHEYDYIISNPPYYKKNSGILSRNEEIAISKFEIKLSLEDLIFNIKRLLKNHGFFFVIIIPERLNDMLKFLYMNKLNILKIRMATHDNKIKFVLIKGQKGSRPKDTIIDTVTF